MLADPDDPPTASKEKQTDQAYRQPDPKDLQAHRISPQTDTTEAQTDLEDEPADAADAKTGSKRKWKEPTPAAADPAAETKETKTKRNASSKTAYDAGASFRKGLQDGIPICLGYFAVSMAYGMAAIVQGLTVTQAVSLSLTNLTSAGQFAGTALIGAGAAMIEILITLVVINARYFLMSLSLCQKIPADTPLWKKMVMAFGVTDEIYAVAMGQKGKITPAYYYGLMVLPILGWSAGTLLGGLASTLLPDDIVNALGIAMYGMFIAIFVPAARKERSVLICVLLAASLSCLFYYTPFLQSLSSGYVIVLVTLVAAGICAWLYPHDTE